MKMLLRLGLIALALMCSAWGSAQGSGARGQPAQSSPSPTSAKAERRIQPQDGYWRWDMGRAQASATCMPGLVESLQRLLPQQRGEHIGFQKPFHPAQLLEHPAVQWQQRGPNHFIASARGVQVQGLALPLDVQYELRVLSPSRMSGQGLVHMQLWQPCAVSAPFHFERAGKQPAAKPAPQNYKSKEK